jgi:serine palmitoyltransferase
LKHLEELLQSITAKDKNKQVLQKRFLVVEGIYQKTGKMVQLDKIVELKNKYKFRLLVDDSVGFGMLGKTGKGIHEHFGIEMNEIDFYVGSLEYGIASVGGFCTSPEEFIVEHQRLFGKGYCFSASSPPYLSVAAIEGMNLIQSKPELLTTLRKNIQLMIQELKSYPSGFQLICNESVPIFQIEFEDGVVLSDEKQEELFDKVVDLCFDDGVAIIRTQFSNQEMKSSKPNLRFTVNVDHSSEDVKKAAKSIKNNLSKILKEK